MRAVALFLCVLLADCTFRTAAKPNSGHGFRHKQLRSKIFRLLQQSAPAYGNAAADSAEAARQAEAAATLSTQNADAAIRATGQPGFLPSPPPPPPTHPAWPPSPPVPPLAPNWRHNRPPPAPRHNNLTLLHDQEANVSTSAWLHGLIIPPDGPSLGLPNCTEDQQYCVYSDHLDRNICNCTFYKYLYGKQPLASTGLDPTTLSREAGCVAAYNQSIGKPFIDVNRPGANEHWQSVRRACRQNPVPPQRSNPLPAGPPAIRHPDLDYWRSMFQRAYAGALLPDGFFNCSDNYTMSIELAANLSGRPAEEVVPEAHHACLLLNEQAANATVDSRLRTTPNERLPQVVNDIWYHTQDIAPQRDPSPPPDVPDGYNAPPPPADLIYYSPVPAIYPLEETPPPAPPPPASPGFPAAPGVTAPVPPAVYPTG